MSKALQPSKLDPLPYHADGSRLFCADGTVVLEGLGFIPTIKFMAVACNSYHDLLAACIEALHEGRTTGHLRHVTANKMADAIAKAEGRTT